MKNNMKKLILTTFTLVGSLIQIGCDNAGSSCNYLQPESVNFETKFNGKSIESLETLKIDFYFFESQIDINNGSVTKFTISDRVSIYNTWNFGDDTTTDSTIAEFPIQENHTETFPITVSIKSDNYKITNLSNGKTTFLPPLTPFSGFIEWKDDNSFSIHRWNDLSQDDGAYSDLNKLVNLDIIHVTDLDTMNLEYSTLLEVRPHLGIHNPPLSPLSNLKIDFERVRKNWTGATKIKVIQNSNNVFHTLSTITLTDGVNTLELIINDKEAIVDGNC